MKLCASNIAWPAELDDTVFRYMRDSGFAGLESAPSRLFLERPYDCLGEAGEFALRLKRNYGLSAASIQSVFYGVKGSIAGPPQERRELQECMHKAVNFADALDCRNIVFGCPKNRRIEAPQDKAVIEEFLLNAADYAQYYGVVIALEPNPAVYGTNFINTTQEAIELITRLNHPALRLNLDFGTVIINGESLGLVRKYSLLVNHVHISEPALAAVTKHRGHAVLRGILEGAGWGKFISIEMRRQDISEIVRVMNYVKEVFA